MFNHMVYLDCDGVFADFVTGILNALEYPDYNINLWPWGRVFDIFPLIGTNWKEASKHCTADFWVNLPWMEDGVRIFGEVFRRFRTSECMLLTKPMDNDESYTGKAQWVSKHMPAMRKRIVPTHIGKEEFCGGFHHLLLDDNQSNIDAWIDKGGAGVLVPRPWNSLDEEFYGGGTVKYISDKLDWWIKVTNHPACERTKGTVCR